MHGKLRSVDLNQLVVLDALLDARGVSAAARRLGLSQSATSHALARLRTQFDDPLLVRGSGGMVPTTRATQLIGPLRTYLEGLHEVLTSDRDFDPATSTRTYRMLSRDYFTTLFLPPLLHHVQQQGPGITLVLEDRGTDPFGPVARGEVDLVLGVFHQELPSSIRRRALCTESMVCVVRQGHPVQTLDVEGWARIPHVLVGMGSPSTPTFIEQVLATHGLERQVALQVPSFAAAAAAVAQTDCMWNAPRRLAQGLAAPMGLRILETPVPVPTFRYSMHWHERGHHDPAMVWLRNVVASLDILKES